MHAGKVVRVWGGGQFSEYSRVLLQAPREKSQGAGLSWKDPLFREHMMVSATKKLLCSCPHLSKDCKISVNLLAETLKQRLSSSSSLHSMWCCPGTRAQLLWAWPHTPSSAQALSRWDRVSPAGHCWSLTANYRYKIKGLALGFRQQFGFCIKLPQPKQDDVKSLLGVSKSFLVTLSSCNDPSSLFEGASLCLQVCPSAPGNAEMWSRI